ncbi:MAG: sugar transferase [Melioribacteraceae bacterium]|nr:sugar transferase [Melioribacteraceae bacterium]
MSKKLENILVLLADFLTINLAWILFWYFRVESGLFKLFLEPAFLLPLAAIYIFWLFVFTFVGMYRAWFASSRFDEMATLFKATFVGVFILFFLILYDDAVHNVVSTSRFIILIYWMLLLTFVGSGRILLRSIQRRLLINGIGRKSTLIVGYNKKAFEMHNTIDAYRGLGIDVVAFVAVKDENIGKKHSNIEVVDTFHNIKNVIANLNISEVILALDKHEGDIMLEVVAACDSDNVSIKIIPDLYEIISGQARTSQLYGSPLINITPLLMPEWEKKIKRLLDLVISIIIIIISQPLFIITAIAIKYESKGPIFYKQERSGLNGKTFKIIKFRSMSSDAEKLSGPVWSTKDDPRITNVGKFIRKVRIDELPQMVNVLKGEMSLVGPRPERPFFVEKLSEEIPFYKRRLKVRPGVTGWAQVKHKYDENVEDVKEKLRYDLFYIENMSLSNDFKILFRTVFVVLFGQGHFN